MWETWVWSLGQEDTLEKRMATHSSILAWKIPWTEGPGKLVHGAGHDWVINTHTHTHSVYMSVTLSKCIPPPSTPSTPGIHMSVFYIYVFISLSQISANASFFWNPHISNTIRYLFFSFWLTSCCMTVSRFLMQSLLCEEQLFFSFLFSEK